MATSRPGLGYPAVNTAPSMDRATAVAIGNARQRLEAIEAAIKAVQITQADTTTTQQITALASSLASITLELASISNDLAIDTVPYIAGEALGVFEAVIPSATGRVVHADPSDPLALYGLIGITISTAALGQTVTVQRRGPVTIVGAHFFDQRAVYAAHDGTLTQTPDYEATALPIGVAIDSTTLFVAPGWPALLGLPIESAVGDTFLKYLPVTYSMIKDLRDLITLLETQAPGPAIWTGADLVTDPSVLPALPSGGLNGTETILVERDGIWCETTVREIWLYVAKMLTTSA